MSAVNKEDNDDSLCANDFLQSNGGSAGQMDIKKAIEDLGTSSKPVLAKCCCFSETETSYSLSVCVDLRNFCYQQDRTPLKAAIQKIHKGFEAFIL